MRYLIEAWLANDAPSSFLTDGGEPVLVPENILEDQLREIRAGTGELGDWRDVAKIGDWRVTKILAHPVGQRQRGRRRQHVPGAGRHDVLFVQVEEAYRGRPLVPADLRHGQRVLRGRQLGGRGGVGGMDR